MPGTSPARNRGAASRRSRGLKVLLGLLLAVAILLTLNTFALNNETESASVNIEGAQLVNTTSGQIQVLDTPPDPSPLPSLGGRPSFERPGVPAAAVPLAPPVVLIHGSGGAINWWDELTPLLAGQGRRVIAIDMLGYGGSDKPSSGYSIESQAGLVAQVLTRLDVDRAAVVGHSLGGKVATALAETSPGLVAGVAILDIAPDSSYGGLGSTAQAARLPVLGQAIWRIAPDFLLRRNLEQAFAPGFEVPEAFVDDINAMTYTAYSDSAEESEAYTDAKPLDQRLEETGLPLLVIFGGQDQIYPARESLSAYAAVRGVETVFIPEAGHSPNVETPEKTAAILGRFVNSLAPEAEPGPAPAGGGNQGEGSNRGQGSGGTGQNGSGGQGQGQGRNGGQGQNNKGGQNNGGGKGNQGGNSGRNQGRNQNGGDQPGA